MNEKIIATRRQIYRQISHWTHASIQLKDLDSLASKEAWHSLERYLGMAIRERLIDAVNRLIEHAAVIKQELAFSDTLDKLERVRNHVLDLRKEYLRTETTLDFYGDAVNTRTNPEIAAILRACDILAARSIQRVLDILNKPTPPILTYVDKGLGASILKAGLRLWDGGTYSPVAAIKIVRHNLLRPTALIHEAGHQLAHIVGWNEELAENIKNRLSKESSELSEIWASWASEIAADAFAFVNTGYAAVAALHDVLSGDEKFVFRFRIGDPHPISYIRVLLGTAMCSKFYGEGPWDDLAKAWSNSYKLDYVNPMIRTLIENSIPLLPSIVDVTLCTPTISFNNRSLCELINPMDVGPKSLAQLEFRAGGSLYTSHYWVSNECLRLLALSGYNIATKAEKQISDLYEKQKQWMILLGKISKAV